MVNGDETPTLEQVIKEGVEARIAELHTCMPGIIHRYDPDKQLADVQPAIQRKYITGTVKNLPLITNVPVKWPRVNGTILHMPMKKGDTVTLAFAERSLDVWLSKGGIVDPLDARKHHLSDAYAYPGGYPFSQPATIVDPESLSLICGAGIKLKFMRDGDADEPFVLGNVLQSLLSDMLTAIATHVHTGNLGAPTTPPLNAASFTLLKASPVDDGEVLSDFIFGAKE